MKRILLALFISLTVAPALSAQETKTLRLKQQKIKYRPQHFHITTVVDDREDTTSIGSMSAGIANKMVRINLQHGLSSSLHQFIHSNLTTLNGSAPVELHITQLAVTEKMNGRREQVDVATGFAFYSNGSKLIEYTGTAYAQTTADASPYIEQLIRRNLETGLQDFDKWWATHRDATSGKPAVKVDVILSDKVRHEEEMPFSRTPLTWDSFQGKADELSLAAAATASGINMQLRSEQKNGTLKVIVTLAPVMDRSRSWVKPEGRNEYALAHEQQHFNITGIVACAFAEEVRRTVFFVENFSGELERMQRKYIKELERMQAEYDAETEHGIKTNAQETWALKLQTQLNSINCY